MESLIKITTNKQGLSVVSARDLHAYLENPDNVNTWFKRQVEKAMLEEGTDFIAISQQTPKGTTGGRPSIDYAITLSSAKEISMLNGGEKGKEARQYFIRCEKIAKEVKALSPLDVMQIAIDHLKSQESRISKTEQAVLMLEARTTTRSNYFTIAGYATLNKMSCGLKLASNLGRKASALCKQREIPTEEILDPRFGSVKTYPITILEEVFSISLV